MPINLPIFEGDWAGCGRGVLNTTNQSSIATLHTTSISGLTSAFPDLGPHWQSFQWLTWDGQAFKWDSILQCFGSGPVRLYFDTPDVNHRPTTWRLKSGDVTLRSGTCVWTIEAQDDT